MSLATPYILIFIVNIVAVIIVMPMAIRGVRFRAKSEVVLPVRPAIKIIVVISSLVFFVTAFPLSLNLVGLLICLAALLFGVDITANSSGVFLFGRVIAWQEIKDISIHAVYLELHLINGSVKRFPRMLWSIRADDLAKFRRFHDSKSLY